MGLNYLVSMNFMKIVLNHGSKTLIHVHVVELPYENNIHCFNDFIFFSFFTIFFNAI